MELGEISVVGGYGHFDLGLAEPRLKVRGINVSESIYLSGEMDGIFWSDFRWIPNCGTRVYEEAAEQAIGIADRLDKAILDGKRVLAAIHTCPWRELNGHPRRNSELDL